MRIRQCDRCGARIEQDHLLMNAEMSNSFLPALLKIGVTLKMPIRMLDKVEWRNVDFCGPCAEKVVFFLPDPEPTSTGGASPKPAIESPLVRFAHSCPDAAGKMTMHMMHVSHPFCPACGLKMDPLALEPAPGTQAELPRQSPACGIESAPQSELTTYRPTKTHRCLEGVGRKGWYDSFPSDIKIDTNVDGTWRCHGQTREWGVAIAHCPFCGVKLGELAAPDLRPQNSTVDSGWSQGLHVMIPLLLRGHRRFLMRQSGTNPSQAIPVKITTPNSVALEHAACEGQTMPWLAQCKVEGDGYPFPQRDLALLYDAFWVLNHEGKQ